MVGGGTGGGMTGGEAMPLTPAAGLTPSAATAQTAMSAADTLAARLPTASNEFAPLTSILKRDFNQPQSAAIGDNAYVKTFSSDGANGFRVTYVVGEEEETVHFVASDYRTTSGDYYTETEDGRRYWLWSYTGSMTGPQRNMGSSLYRYFDTIGTSVTIDGVSTVNYLTYGLRTDGGGLPSGSAHYGARLLADIYDSDAPAISDRTRIWANVRLTVDFGEGSLDGDIRGFRVREPGQAVVTLPPTVYAEIEDGQIADGRFTATWTWAQVSPGEGAFAGNVLGEFYGPNAEEVGAVLNGANDDEVIAGVIGGVRPTPSVPAGDLAVLSSGSYQDVSDSTATAATASVTAIAGDGADGFDLTYTIGADTHQVQLGADDFGADTVAGRERNYYEGDYILS